MPGTSIISEKISTACKRSVLLFGLVAAADTPGPAQAPGTFSPTGRMLQPRSNPTVTLLQDGRVLIAGGCNACTAAEIYDPATESFTATGHLVTGRSDFAAIRLLEGTVLVAGGSKLGRYAELYNPATSRFQPSGLMVVAHANSSAALLANGKVLFVGGTRPDFPTVMSSAELYDPAGGTFASLGWTPGVGATATSLPNGKALIAGGGMQNALVFDPATNSLIPTGRFATYSSGMHPQTATLLINGMVLLTGGGDLRDSSLPLANAELYEPATGRFASVGPMLRPRRLHTATSLPGGAVLLAGDGNAELYDPLSGKFSEVGRMTAVRIGHGAALLPDGRVLFAGGDGSSAELYTPSIRVISAASLGAPLARGSLGLLVGSRLAAVSATAGPHSPGTVLGGISLRVRDRTGGEFLARLLAVSPAQINFEMPPGAAAGEVSIEVVGAASEVPRVTATVGAVAPGLFALADGTAAAYGVRTELDGGQTVLPPGEITLDERPVHLVVYATGIRNRSRLDAVRAEIGETTVAVKYAGPAGDGLPGLDQINVELSPALRGLGVRRVKVTVDGVVSNSVIVDVR
jgi:uncharacterized protein (TIGR03437 family)